MVFDRVHPHLEQAVTRVFAAMKLIGHSMKATDGLRTDAQQAALYAQGRTTPGTIVTYADGVITKSNHQAHADRLGHAVDCTFVDEQGQPRWVDSDPWFLFGTAVEAEGLKWGGRFTHPDRPHVELPETS